MPDMPAGAQPLPKLLIVAPNASSVFGGEAYIPLRYFAILKDRGYPVTLVTHARNRADLAQAVAAHVSDIAFVEDTAMHRALHRWSGRCPKIVGDAVFGTLMAALDGVLQTRLVRRIIHAERPDVIHQPTPVSPLAPSGLHRFGLPLVVGPMNGGMHYPPGYADLENGVRRRFVALSRGIARGLNRLVPGKRHAAVLLVANRRTRDALPFRRHRDIRTLVENGVDLATWTSPQPARVSDSAAAGSLRLVYMGRLVDWKLVDVTLDAVRLAINRDAAIRLDIVGDGPERGRLEARAAELDLEHAVRFTGFLPQPRCAELLAEADALILNSVWECGGAVVLEAMAAGLPVIASDWGGPADYLDAGCGILVSPVPRAGFAMRLADAVLRLADDPPLRRTMGQAGARKVAERYDWQKKVDAMIGIYAEVARGQVREAGA